MPVRRDHPPMRCILVSFLLIIQWHHTTGQTSCASVSACLADTSCRTCLQTVGDALNADDGSLSGQDQVDFFMVLLSTPSCDPRLPSAELVAAALREIVADSVGTCNGTHLDIDPCMVQEHGCLMDTNSSCSDCLSVAYQNTSLTAQQILHSPACKATNNQTLQHLADTACFAFPVCTFAKNRCADDAECAECLTMLGRGLGAAAALNCSTGQVASLIDTVVLTCTGFSHVGCNFRRTRCNQNSYCGSCFGAMGQVQSIQSTVAGVSSPACDGLRHDANGSFRALETLFLACPASVQPVCPIYGFAFAMAPNGLGCLNGSISPQNPTCADISHTLSTVCAPCPALFHTVNAVTIATAVVGAISVVACIIVLITLFAYRHDVDSLAHRVLIGLFCANFVYSTANMIPMNLLETDIARCGQLVLSYSTIRFGRSWWFGGKYGLVAFEALILGASSYLLTWGKPFSRRVEQLLHLTCVLCGVAAFTAFYIQCLQINRQGYNAATQDEAQADTFTYLSATDDLDDNDPSTAAEEKFHSARTEYTSLVQRMLQVWAGLLGATLLMWCNLRRLFARLTALWQQTCIEADESNKLYGTPKGERYTKGKLLRLVKCSYDEVARPLEPYVAVFAFFGIPAIIMATDFCQARSGQTYRANTGNLEFGFGVCDMWCEFALSFRTLASAMVYFWPKRHRDELYNVRTTLSRLKQRLKWTQHGVVRFDEDSLEQVQMIPQGDETDAHLYHRLLDETQLNNSSSPESQN